MKCIKKGADIQRVSDEAAAAMVKDGWKYCPKKEWRVLRDANKPKPAAEENQSPEKKNKKSGKGDRKARSKEYHSSKYNRKQDRREEENNVSYTSPAPVRPKNVMEILDDLD